MVAVDGSLSVVAAYLLGYVNATREFVNCGQYMEMRLNNVGRLSMEQAADDSDPKWGRTYRDEHEPGAVRHVVDREGWRLDNKRGERGYVRPAHAADATLPLFDLHA